MNYSQKCTNIFSSLPLIDLPAPRTTHTHISSQLESWEDVHWMRTEVGKYKPTSGPHLSHQFLCSLWAKNECLVTSVVSNSVRPYGLQPARLLYPWDSPSKNTGVGCHALLQGIFPTHGSNPGLPPCPRILDHLSQGSIYNINWATVLENTLFLNKHQHLVPYKAFTCLKLQLLSLNF